MGKKTKPEETEPEKLGHYDATEEETKAAQKEALLAAVAHWKEHWPGFGDGDDDFEVNEKKRIVTILGMFAVINDIGHAHSEALARKNNAEWCHLEMPDQHIACSAIYTVETCDTSGEDTHPCCDGALPFLYFAKATRLSHILGEAAYLLSEGEVGSTGFISPDEVVQFVKNHEG